MKFAKKMLAAAIGLAISGAALATGGSNANLIVQVYDPVSQTVLDTVISQGPSTTAVSGAFSLTGWSSFTAAATGASSGWEFTIFGSNTTPAGDIGTTGTDTWSSGSLTTLYGATETQTLNAIASAATTNYALLTGATTFNLNGLSGDAATLNPSGLYYFAGTGSRPAAGTLLAALSLNTSTGLLTIGTASPTPEPGTYALMAAGLLAVGAIARRRARS